MPRKQKPQCIYGRGAILMTTIVLQKFLSDGDSKACTAVVHADVYSGTVEIEKEDCTNHVAERLGTALRKLKEPAIHKLQAYYQVAITSNRGNVKEMHQAIWASYLKYLTKKYLKKNNLRDWLRVVATTKEAFELRYFQINNEEEEDDEDND
ncbi:hypothetical protein HPB50_015632 [Hyalomma asiaticum]|uniref:Uncharacterized protein n=1 Tax=Hyalomma asiaticum TaxID=266040 RepID=A0ACB7SFV4_HYAAI|nr:hypothetical protein HPB50_015632 [Hyalomma asiaticum]